MRYKIKVTRIGNYNIYTANNNIEFKRIPFSYLFKIGLLLDKKKSKLTKLVSSFYIFIGGNNLIRVFIVSLISILCTHFITNTFILSLLNGISNLCGILVIVKLLSIVFLVIKTIFVYFDDLSKTLCL